MNLCNDIPEKNPQVPTYPNEHEVQSLRSLELVCTGIHKWLTSVQMMNPAMYL